MVWEGGARWGRDPLQRDGQGFRDDDGTLGWVGTASRFHDLCIFAFLFCLLVHDRGRNGFPPFSLSFVVAAAQESGRPSLLEKTDVLLFSGLHALAVGSSAKGQVVSFLGGDENVDETSFDASSSGRGKDGRTRGAKKRDPRKKRQGKRTGVLRNDLGVSMLLLVLLTPGAPRRSRPERLVQKLQIKARREVRHYVNPPRKKRRVNSENSTLSFPARLNQPHPNRPRSWRRASRSPSCSTEKTAASRS